MGSGLVFRFTGFLAGRWEWVGRDVGGGSEGEGGGVGWREKSGPYFNSTGPLACLVWGGRVGGGWEVGAGGGRWGREVGGGREVVWGGRVGGGREEGGRWEVGAGGGRRVGGGRGAGGGRSLGSSPGQI